MRTKINRPVAETRNVHHNRQEWYDLGYSDAQEDFINNKDSDAYDTGYDNGLTDGRKEPTQQQHTRIFDQGWCEGRDSAEIEFVKNGRISAPIDVLQDKWSLIELQIKGIIHILRSAEGETDDGY